MERQGPNRVILVYVLGVFLSEFDSQVLILVDIAATVRGYKCIRERKIFGTTADEEKS